MQIQKINSRESFGIMPQPMPIITTTPAIVRECTGWLAQGKNTINYLKDTGITLQRGKKFIDIYEGEQLLGWVQKQTTPKLIEKFVKLLKEIRKEFPEYTDSKIKLVRPEGIKSISEPIVTRKLKGQGRQNIDLAPGRKFSIQETRSSGSLA